MNKLLTIGLLLFAVTACNTIEVKKTESPALRVHTMVISEKSSNSVARYVGTVEPAQETPLSLQTSGRVVAIEAKNGHRVRKGQTILKVDNTQALNALETAKATLRHAQDAFDRVSKVHEKGVVSDQKMVEIESQYAKAKSVYAAAKEQLKECILTAPCDGVLSGLDVTIGQTIIPGVTICSILDVSGFTVRFTVPEAEIDHLAEQGEMQCEAIKKTLPVTLTSKSVIANNLTHTYEAKARIDGGKEVLRTGMVGIVCLPILHSEAIVIPAKCVLLKPEHATVWVKQDSIAIRRVIAVGGYGADGVRVLDGLQEGDVIITDGYQKLYEGCKIVEE